MESWQLSSLTLEVSGRVAMRETIIHHLILALQIMTRATLYQGVPVRNSNA